MTTISGCTFTVEQDIDADPAAVWAVWTDVERFPDWDPREVYVRLIGDFAVNGRIESKQRGNPAGVSTISAIDPGRRWVATTPLPGGALTISHDVADIGGGRTRVAKTYTATGPMAVIFRLWFGPRLRAVLPESLARLEAEARRRG